MQVTIQGNQLFLDNNEAFDLDGDERKPSHLHPIRFAAASVNELYVISDDAAGNEMKIWNFIGERVWVGKGYKDATAIAVTNDGDTIAIACGLAIFIRHIVGSSDANTVFGTTVSLKDKVVSLQFTDNSHLVCRDSEGNKATIEYNGSSWGTKE